MVNAKFLEQLRTPLFIAALVSFLLAFFLEIGSRGLASFLSGFLDSAAIGSAASADAPPGLAISYLSLFDGLLLYSLSLIALSMAISDALHARIQGIATFIFSLIIIIASLVLIFGAITKLMIMLGMLFAPIFGTIAYFSLYSSFPTTSSKTILSLLMLFKLGFAAALLFAHQRFLQNKSLVILTAFSLVLGILISFLHGIVPVFLISITDAIAAIIIGVVALIWAVLYFVGSITSIVRAI